MAWLASRSGTRQAQSFIHINGKRIPNTRTISQSVMSYFKIILLINFFVGGYYSVCIDNQFSRFAAKLVNLYITVVRPERWDAFTKELESLDVSVTNFTVCFLFPDTYY